MRNPKFDLDALKTCEPTVREMLGTSDLPQQYSGPALYAMCCPDRPNKIDGGLLIGPMANYSDLSLLFQWKADDPMAVLRAEVFQTTDSDWSFDRRHGGPATWKPMLTTYDEAFSAWLVDPLLPANENTMILAYTGRRIQAFAFRLTTAPKGARLFARVWVLMCGYRPSQDSPLRWMIDRSGKKGETR